MKTQDREAASFEVEGAERSRVVGTLGFGTVSALLPAGSDAIQRGQAAIIDLAGVANADSSGLALLIEWLSVAKEARRTLRYENIPLQVDQLARLSDVEALITAA